MWMWWGPARAAGIFVFLWGSTVSAMNLDHLGPVLVGFTLEELNSCPKLLIPSPRSLLEAADGYRKRIRNNPALLSMTWAPATDSLIDRKSELSFSAVDPDRTYLYRASLPFDPKIEGYRPFVEIDLEKDENIREEMKRQKWKTMAEVPPELLVTQLWIVGMEQLVKPLGTHLWQAMLKQAERIAASKKLPPNLAVVISEKRDVILARLAHPEMANGKPDPNIYQVVLQPMSPYLYVHVSMFLPGDDEKRKHFEMLPAFPIPGIRKVGDNYARTVPFSAYFDEDGAVHDRAVAAILKMTLEEPVPKE